MWRLITVEAPLNAASCDFGPFESCSSSRVRLLFEGAPLSAPSPQSGRFSTRKRGNKIGMKEPDARGSLFHEVKAAKNQSLFREVNERLKEVGEHSESMSYAEDAICECADDTCSDRISLSNAEYERVRANSTWFAVGPAGEHVFPEVERVVEKHKGYWIVEKLDGAAAVAEKHDPRTRSARL
jgi:hypothetical protein